MPDHERTVFIDIETATETVTRDADIHRIRREAGVEEGEAPPRSLPNIEDHPEAHAGVEREFDPPPPTVTDEDRRAARQEATDSQRQHGVPPPTNLDLDEQVDRESAESFPASDPPTNY